MPVPSSITDLSTNPTSNSPQGSESAKGTVDDYFRTGFAFIAQLNALVAGSTISLASADTVAIGAAASGNISITGTTTITAFDTVAEGVMRWVTFAGALTLTHNATKLQLPGAASITTVAGDAALFKSLGGGNWKCLTLQRSAGYISQSGTTPFLSFKPASLSSGPVLWQATQPDGKTRLQLGFDTSGTPFFNTYNASGAFVGNIAVTAGGFVASGNITCQTLTQTSDERKKTKWQRLPGDFIARLAGIRKSGLFQWKKDGSHALGVGAQSLEQILPQAVHTDDKGAKTVNYGAAALVSAVELAREVIDLKARLAKLEAR